MGLVELLLRMVSVSCVGRRSGDQSHAPGKDAFPPGQIRGVPSPRLSARNAALSVNPSY
jgi:hypothetical protein